MAESSHDSDTEKPLDPAAERVRRKLVRFAAINLGILFAAVMAVLAAIVYKSGISEPKEEAPSATLEVLPSGEISLPSGARIISQSLSGNRLALHVALAGGAQAIIVYDVARGRVLGRFDVTGLPPER